jgi:hypothetical protein
MTYNLTNVTDSNTLLDLATSANNLSSGTLAISSLLLIFIISFLGAKTYDTEVALIISSFVTSIISILFFIIGWIGIEVLVVPLIMLVGSIFMNIINK